RLAGNLAELVLVAVDGEQLLRRLDAFVEIDRLAVFRPEADRQIAVEAAVELLERLAPIGHRAQIDTVVGHAVALHVVGRAVGDVAAVGRELRRGLADFGILREAFNLARRDLDQIEVRVQTLLGDVAFIPLWRTAAKTNPLAVAADRELRDGVLALLAEPYDPGGRFRTLSRKTTPGVIQIQGPVARRRRLGIADVDREALVSPGLLFIIELVGRDEVDALVVGRPFPGVHAGGLLREVLRFRGFERRHRHPEQLPRLGATRAVGDRAAVRAQGEVHDAVFGVGDLPRFAAIHTHHEDLVLRGAVRGSFAVGEEEEGRSVRQPGRRRLVLRRRKRHLLR